MNYYSKVLDSNFHRLLFSEFLNFDSWFLTLRNGHQANWWEHTNQLVKPVRMIPIDTDSISLRWIVKNAFIWPEMAKKNIKLNKTGPGKRFHWILNWHIIEIISGSIFEIFGYHEMAFDCHFLKFRWFLFKFYVIYSYFDVIQHKKRVS